MASYVQFSITGSTTGYLKVQVEDWKHYRADNEEFTGLNGDSTISIGAIGAKNQWKFNALVQQTGTTGYASWTDMIALMNPSTTTAALPLMQDVNGTDYSVVVPTGYAPQLLTNGLRGASEYARIPMRIKQR